MRGSLPPWRTAQCLPPADHARPVQPRLRKLNNFRTLISKRTPPIHVHKIIKASERQARLAASHWPAFSARQGAACRRDERLPGLRRVWPLNNVNARLNRTDRCLQRNGVKGHPAGQRDSIATVPSAPSRRLASRVRKCVAGQGCTGLAPHMEVGAGMKVLGWASGLLAILHDRCRRQRVGAAA